MSGVLVIKGHGVFSTEVANDLFGGGDGTKRVFSPSEVGEDGISPFHVNPHTGKRYGETEGVDSHHKFHLKDHMTAIVDECTRTIRKSKPDLDENAVKTELRQLLNDSNKEFNSHKELTDPHRFPEEVFSDPSDPTSLNPAMVSNTFASRYQKLARKSDGMDWAPVRDELHPRDVQIRNANGEYPDLVSSNKAHQQHGHMSEAAYYAALNIFLKNYQGRSKDPNSSLYLGGEGARIPKNLSSGVIEPSALAFVELNGQLHTLQDRRKSTMPPNLGRAPKNKNFKDHGYWGYMNSVLSLHPAFFEEATNISPNDNRMGIAQSLLTGGTQAPDIDQSDIVRLAQSPIAHILEVALTSGGLFRSGSKVKNIYRAMQSSLGIPIGETAGLSPEQEDRLTEFNHNSDHIGIDNRINGQRLESSHAAADMRRLLYMSMRLAADEEANTRLAGTLNQPNFATGQAVKERLIRNYPQNQPMGPSEFSWTSADNISRMVETPPASYKAGTPYVGEEQGQGAGWGQRVSSTLGLINPFSRARRDDDEIRDSMDRLCDVMESLQSADARMDMTIMKALPAQRRFNLNDRHDVFSLCDTFSLEERDLHYIQQTMGDWTTIAQDLKVDNGVVKAVKVALRW